MANIMEHYGSMIKVSYYIQQSQYIFTARVMPEQQQLATLAF